MKLEEMKSNGHRSKRNRVGRGPGSGNGKTSGRGQKGQKSRSGGGVRLGFEGGQTTLARRLPKRGFTNFNRKEYAIVNVETLNKYDDGTVVNAALLLEDKVIKKELSGLKILGNGELTKKLTVQAAKFSASAKEAIEKAGGTAGFHRHGRTCGHHSGEPLSSSGFSSSSAAFLIHFMPSAGSFSTPRPERYIPPRLRSASELPCSAAFRKRLRASS